MKRAALLHELTGLMGEALRQLEAEGKPMDERSTRLWADRVIDLYKKLPEIPNVALADSVLEDEVNHGGLLRRETLHLANAARKYGKSPVDYDPL